MKLNIYMQNTSALRSFLKWSIYGEKPRRDFILSIRPGSDLQDQTHFVIGIKAQNCYLNQGTDIYTHVAQQ